jgi:hypothetical protein
MQLNHSQNSIQAYTISTQLFWGKNAQYKDYMAYFTFQLKLYIYISHNLFLFFFFTTIYYTVISPAVVNKTEILQTNSLQHPNICKTYSASVSF